MQTRLPTDKTTGRNHRPGRPVRARSTPHSSSAWSYRLRPAFTLIELILVMAILTMAVAVTAPTLSNFFRGRTLDAEARRLLALTRTGKSRSVSEGVPMDLWINSAAQTFGLEAEPSYEPNDSHAQSFSLDGGLQVEVVAQNVNPAPQPSQNRNLESSTVSTLRVTHAHPELPSIRFLPDGSISEASPQAIHLMGRDGVSLWLMQTRDRSNYEIRNTDK